MGQAWQQTPSVWVWGAPMLRRRMVLELQLAGELVEGLPLVGGLV